MDHGTQLWKKKTSEKTIVANDKIGLYMKGNQEEKTLHENITSLLCECNAKDDLVSNHSKVAQEAIAGWEKAKAEAALRKQELDEALHQKVAERERFYAELKDRILQLSFAREEQDERVHKAVVKASKELEKKYKKLEEKYVETSGRVADLSVENLQLTKALLLKEKLNNDVSEQMSKVTGEFNILMAKLDSTEKENAFLKYELQMLEKEIEIQNEALEFNRRSADALEKKHLEQISQASGEFNILMAKLDSTEKEKTFLNHEFQMLEKELAIRNEELEFNRRSADALEKKHLESVKKIRRLEAECQSLRVLVEKRLPGPAALAKMKREVKMQGRGPREVSERRISLMMERACDVEEENKILKEIAGSKDEELRSLRTAFALLASKLSQVEDQLGDHSKSPKSMELIDRFGSWAAALLSQLENLKQEERENASEGRMIGVSDHLMDDFVEMEKLAIVSVNPPSGDSCDSVGKELVPVKEYDSIDMESKDLSTEKSCDWIQNVLKEILEQTRVSKRSIDEILEDIRVALKYTDQLGPTIETEASKSLPISGYINWNSSDSVGMENQLGESELERLQLELESLQESKRLVEDQLENQKRINEDLDTQLTVSKVQLNELLQKLSSLEVELEDRSHYCEELEATCLELQVQLQSVSSKEIQIDNEELDEKSFQTGWEIPADLPKIVVCQDTILNHGEELKSSPKESPVVDKVLSKSSDKTSTLHASLRDRILAEDGVVIDDPNTPQTKEIISTTEMKVSSIVHSSSGPSLYEVPGAQLVIVTNKKRSGGISLLRKLLFRRKKGGNKKKSSLLRGRSPRPSASVDIKK